MTGRRQEAEPAGRPGLAARWPAARLTYIIPRWEREFLIMPIDGMYMWLRLFRWPIITGRCWPGVLRPSPRKNLRSQGVVSSKSTKMIRFKGKLCYCAIKKTIGALKGELLRISSTDDRFLTSFFDPGGEGCDIISGKSILIQDISCLSPRASQSTYQRLI